MQFLATIAHEYRLLPNLKMDLVSETTLFCVVDLAERSRPIRQANGSFREIYDESPSQGCLLSHCI